MSYVFTGCSISTHTDHQQPLKCYHFWWQNGRKTMTGLHGNHASLYSPVWALQLLHSYRYSYISIINDKWQKFKTWVWNLRPQTLTDVHYSISSDVQDIVDHRLKQSPNQLNKDVLYNHIGIRNLTAEPSSRGHAPWPSVKMYFLVSSVAIKAFI